ncbi:MAG: hypothetical protein HY785_18630 [Oscillatoriophycideae cyanobacterium NC_groundwater_1537_Pr4_S-0.65um_50_18]|nr:hypothetical protein [Oscillatoriophycideae cyanobacterium NC_groundwater_1537_Pr4_S-0.65um_50_18]
MDRQKFVAIVTGAIAVLLSIAYLLIVQLLDFRGEMLPAPTDLSSLVTPPIAFTLSLFTPAAG